MNLPSVGIIVVNYNGRHLLKDCFESLIALNYPEDKLEIILVDNNSTDDSVEFVHNNFSQIRIIENNENNYALANNLGIREAKGEFVALINNDLKVEKDWLIELIKVINQDDKICAVTGKVLFSDGKLQATGHYEFPNFYWSDRGFKEEDRGQYNEIQEIKSLSHCVALYRKKCFERIGLLDEDFNMYVEDVDMSIRIRQQGWRIVYVPESVAKHKFHGSASEEKINFLCERNRLLLIAKHYPERLTEALYGKGYFTILNQKNELIKILPDVFAKLIKHHGREKLILILPELFETLDKILNLEKDHLIKQLDNEKTHLDLLQQTVSQKDQFLQEKDKEISQLREDINQKLNLLSQKDQEILTLKDQINQIYNSETYRFIAQPIWKVLDIVKRLKPKPKTIKQKRILIIKPFYVGVEDTEKALEYFRKFDSNMTIYMVANLSEEDYIRLSNNQNIDEKIFYSSSYNKLKGLTYLKLFFKLRRTKFDEAILLIGDIFYGRYRKAKLLAMFSGAKKIKLYFVHTANVQTLSSFTPFKMIWQIVYSSILLFLILVWFFIFIIIPLKLKKFFRR